MHVGMSTRKSDIKHWSDFLHTLMHLGVFDYTKPPQLRHPEEISLPVDLVIWY